MDVHVYMMTVNEITGMLNRICILLEYPMSPALNALLSLITILTPTYGLKRITSMINPINDYIINKLFIILGTNL